MRGYPGSGKSTIAGLHANTGWAVISRDDLRKQMFGTYRPGPDGEDAVTLVETAAVEALIRDGRNVVVDAMHVNPRYLRKWAQLAAQHGADFTVQDVPTSVDECIRRDEAYDRFADGKHVGEKVIRKIAKKWPIEKWPVIKPQVIDIEPYVPPPGAAPAIIVDIDGTLAHMTGRSPYDYDRVGEDDVDVVIRRIVRTFDMYAHVLLLSGRDSSCRAETINWLQVYEIPFDLLLMRPESAVDNHGNKLPDWQVKLALFNEHIRQNYDVQFVIDDRQQVVAMWRRLGLKCLQPQEGNF